MGQMGMNQTTDSYSRNIQNQIANAQKQLQELSSNKDMTLEEKMNKRQEIQQQINDLNVQLRQHQMEQRREKQYSFDDMIGGNQKTGAADMGVIILLSTAKEQIDNITQNIGDKVKETQDIISDYQKAEQDKTLDKKEDEKENETNVVSEEDNGSVEVESAESANVSVQVQPEKE